MISSTQTVTSGDPVVLIALALIGLVGIITSSWFSYKGMIHARGAAKNASEANDAVNHRAPGEDRLFDMVADTRAVVKDLLDWKDKWENVSSHVSDPSALVTHLAVIEDRIKVSAKDTTDRIMRLHSHVDEKIGEVNSKVDHLNRRMEAVDSFNDVARVSSDAVEQKGASKAQDGIISRRKQPPKEGSK